MDLARKGLKFPSSPKLIRYVGRIWTYRKAYLWREVSIEHHELEEEQKEVGVFATFVDLVQDKASDFLTKCVVSDGQNLPQRHARRHVENDRVLGPVTTVQADLGKDMAII